ncbi:hypothetical protein BC829DRAFT_442371 [Chytridium lagenaria]|nr:hypothetical protein BC829DRAFT_442371 [Chytridium lagenaria]
MKCIAILFVISALFTKLSLIAASAAEDCDNRACILIAQPVCGSDFRTYGNSCMLRLAACSYPSLNLSKLSDGPCTNVECDKIVCPPVDPNQRLFCGSDGVDYTECALDVAKCRNPSLNSIRDDPCNCDLITCTDDAIPVCDSNGNVYENSCALRKKSCQTSAVITPVSCPGILPTLPATGKVATGRATVTIPPTARPTNKATTSAIPITSGTIRALSAFSIAGTLAVVFGACIA